MPGLVHIQGVKQCPVLPEWSKDGPSENKRFRVEIPCFLAGSPFSLRLATHVPMARSRHGPEWDTALYTASSDLWETEIWLTPHAKYHQDEAVDRPSVVYVSHGQTQKTYYVKGVRHRDNGMPAIDGDSVRMWYIRGVRVEEPEAIAAAAMESLIR
jgi:hypothetical protein